MLRVISGKLRGLKLDSPDGTETRPTLDRVKEALFNIIFTKVYDANVLDLFAGSGSLGIETLSRGSDFCTFVDNNTSAVEIIKSNLKKAHITDRYNVFLTDAINFLNSTDKKYDIIFLDPPYKAGLYEELLSVIKKRKLLKDNGIVVAECDSSNAINCDGYNILKDRTYGKARIYVLEVSAEQ